METLERFYSDPRRRASREIRFGTGWRSSKLNDFEFVVFWVAATEELCLLKAPIRGLQSDGMFSRFILGIPPHTNPRPLGDNEVTVEVLAKVAEEDLSETLAGWEDHLADPDGLGWIKSVSAETRPG
ncbi:MAG: hypothetical protein ACRDJI_04820 [Actinomycetota bacterium]